MASRATYDAGAAALDAFAQFMMGRQAKKEARAERQEEMTQYEKALETREIKREKREEENLKKRAVGRSGVYERPNKYGFGKEYVNDELNALGDTVGERFANPREVSEYKRGQEESAAKEKSESEKMNRELEDRTLKNTDLFERLKIAERNAAANELRASRTGLSEEKAEKPLSRNEALKALSSFRYRAQEGESARDVAERDGVDYDSLVETANRGAEKKPGLVERGVNAVGNAISSFAGAFSAPKKSPPVLGKPGEKEKAPYPDGTKLRKGGKVYVVRNGVPVLEE